MNDKWDMRFLELAKHISTYSKDPSTKVGAVVVDELGRVVGTGYNGFPRGVKDTDERYNNRELKYKLVAHAELNAILLAGDKARGSTIYVYPGFGSPNLCTECAKAVIQSGIKRAVGLVPPIDAERKARWRESLDIAQMMCDEAGVETVEYPEESKSIL